MIVENDSIFVNTTGGYFMEEPFCYNRTAFLGHDNWNSSNNTCHIIAEDTCIGLVSTPSLSSPLHPSCPLYTLPVPSTPSLSLYTLPDPLHPPCPLYTLPVPLHPPCPSTPSLTPCTPSLSSTALLLWKLIWLML